MEIPTREWVHITTYLVTNILDPYGYTGIGVFIDKLAKMIHLTYCTKEATAIEYANVFVDHIFSLHCLLIVIISH